jgi:hypothetical protein
VITSSSCKPIIFFIALSVFSFQLFSCSAENDPETILQDYILACKKVVKERRFRSIKDLISDSYQDSQSRRKNDLIAMARTYMLRNRSINIFSHPLTVTQSDSANQLSASVLVALSGIPIEDVAMLPTVHADIYLFELNLIREKDDWKLFSSSWRQAMLDDLRIN